MIRKVVRNIEQTRAVDVAIACWQCDIWVQYCIKKIEYCANKALRSWSAIFVYVAKVDWSLQLDIKCTVNIALAGYRDSEVR